MKRKSDEHQQNDNPWTQLAKDNKGRVKELYVRQVRDNDDALPGEKEKATNANANGGNAANNGNETAGDAAANAKAAEQNQKLGIFQGKRYVYQKKRLPIPRGQPTADVTGFRSITLDGMQDWENGIDPEVMEMLTQVQPLVAKDQGEDAKFCLGIYLPYAFKGNQATNFGRNLDQLLAIPGIQDSIGALSYSEGGHLAEMLARFPHLGPNPKFLYRYDQHVYAENDTLVEDYFADLEHWLFSQWSQPPPNSDLVRQARLKFVIGRNDQAEEMIGLLKENFQKATSAYADQHSFVIRLDCPNFSLEPFHIENNKTSEILALEFKDETVVKGEDADIDDFEEEEEEPAEKKRETGGAKDGVAQNGQPDGTEGGKQGKEQKEEEEEEHVVWKSYKLVRAKDANEFGRLMDGQLALIKRKINIIY